jgi:iron complex outermembrane receptor protein
LLWTPTEHQTVWAAASRAIRTPTVGDRDVRANVLALQPSPFGPTVLVSSFGNPRIQSEELTSYELGYRIDPTKQLSFDLAGFYNVYDKLVGYVPGTPRFETDPAPAHLLSPVTAQNSESGETYGAEISARWQVMDHWRLVGSYTWLHMRLHPDQSPEGDSPQQQFQLRSYVDLPHHVELNGALYYVDSISAPTGQTRSPIPSYVRLDLGMTWRPKPSLEIGIWGQNLLDDRHQEFNSIRSPLRTEVPRGVMGKITWRF